MSDQQVYCEESDKTQCGDLVVQKFVTSNRDDQIVLSLSYNGCFLVHLLKYGGVGLELSLCKINKLSYREMCSLLLEKVEDDIWRWFFKKPDCSLEDGLTLVEKDMDVSRMYEMAEVHGYLEVFVAHFPQYLLVDYYLKNLFNDPNDVEVTTLLKSHEQIEIDFPGTSLRKRMEWEKKEQTSPKYIFSPLYNTPRVFMIGLKGKALLEEFEAEEGATSHSSRKEWISGNDMIVEKKGKELAIEEKED